MTYPSGTGLSTAYSYFNNVGDQRLQTIQNWKSNGTVNVSKFDYTYNPVGTIATWTTQADASAAIVNTYSYDGADQLINAVQTGGGSATNAYRYDPAGNRLSENASGTTTLGNFNNLNQLKIYGAGTNLTVAGNTSASVNSATVDAISSTITSGTNFSSTVALPLGTNVVSVVANPTATTTPTTTKRYQIVTTTGTAPASLSYDANGNITTDQSGNTYQWDALNRLIKFTYPGGATSNFAYDGLSRRVSIIEKNSSGTVTSTKLYVWIGNQMAEERDASNTVQKRFFPQGEIQSGTSYYYLRDHLGSVRELMSSAAAITARYGYDAYGKTTVISGTNLSTFQYAGYYKHQPSGLKLTIFRGFDSVTGRWTSRDPIAENGGINLYCYCHNNPTSLWDVLGLAEGTFDITFPATEPNEPPTKGVNSFNQNVDIIYHEDVKCTCKQIRFVQWAQNALFEFTPSIDNLNAPIITPKGNINTRSFLYPGQEGTMDGAHMWDQPGPGKAANIPAALLWGYRIDFKVCAVCTDSFPFKVLGCRNWVGNGLFWFSSSLWPRERSSCAAMKFTNNILGWTIVISIVIIIIHSFYDSVYRNERSKELDMASMKQIASAINQYINIERKLPPMDNAALAYELSGRHNLLNPNKDAVLVLDGIIYDPWAKPYRFTITEHKIRIDSSEQHYEITQP